MYEKNSFDIKTFIHEIYYEVFHIDYFEKLIEKYTVCYYTNIDKYYRYDNKYEYKYRLVTSLENKEVVNFTLTFFPFNHVSYKFKTIEDSFFAKLCI